MSEWSGLDTAGVEFLWEGDILQTVLEIYQRHEPVSHSDQDSPIYEELGEQFPDRTWYSIGQNGFRPLFRRANPLLKIGLIEGDGQSANVTELGKQLLDHEIDLATVFRGTLKLFVESDQTRSFSEMAKAGLALPNHVFTLEDIEYSVSRVDGDIEKLESTIQANRKKGLRVSDIGRRRRKLRSFMTALSNSGAFAPTEDGWILDDKNAALEIADALKSPLSTDLEMSDAISSHGGGGIVSEIAAGARHVPKIGASDLSKMDPAQRALLLEKAHSEHERIIELAAAEIRIVGGVPFEDSLSFDVACDAPTKMLLEAKHIHKANGVSQLRKAIAQLPEYRWRYNKRFDSNTVQVAALSCDPRPIVGDDYLNFIEEDRNIPVIWRDEDRLVDRQGKSLRDYLVPSP